VEIKHTNPNPSIVRKISGSTSGLTLFGNYDHIDQIEIDEGGPGTHGSRDFQPVVSPNPCFGQIQNPAGMNENSPGFQAWVRR